MRVLATGEVVLSVEEVQAVYLFVQWARQHLVSPDAYTVDEVALFARDFCLLTADDGL
jgi:hypothetical protein